MATVTTTNTNDSYKNEQQEPAIETHPLYDEQRNNYIKVCDCLEGEERIKKKGADYLPKTSAQKEDDATGDAYDAYKTRSIYYNYPRDLVDAAVGMLHREPAMFEPFIDSIQVLIESATMSNESLLKLLTNINEAQIAYGGIGLLVDVPQGDASPVVPYIVKYSRMDIVNWEEDIDPATGRNRLRMVTLSESGYEIRTGGAHEWIEKYRVCALDETGMYWTATMWWEVRERFRKTYEAVTQDEIHDPADLISLSSDIDELQSVCNELSQPTYKTDGKGRIVIDKSPDGARSPNTADAIIIAFARLNLSKLERKRVKGLY